MDRVNALWAIHRELWPLGTARKVSDEDEDAFLDDLVDTSIMEYHVYYETFESLMDEGTGMTWMEYISR